MSAINNINNSENQPAYHPLTLPGLQDDPFNIIISQSGLTEIQSLASTSKIMNKITIENSNAIMLGNVEKYIDALMVPLKTDTHPKQIKELNEIKSELVLNNSNKFPLIQLKANTLSYKEKTINALKGLDEETFTSLKKIATPPFLEFTVQFTKDQIVEIYRRIPIANAKPNQDERSWALGVIIQDLAALEEIDMATHVANTYFPHESASILATSAGWLADNPAKVKQAIELNHAALKIAKTMPEGDKKAIAIHAIDDNWAEIISSLEDFNESIKIADLIQNTNIKAKTLSKLAIELVLVEENELAIEINERAFELAKTMTDGDEKTSLLCDIARTFTDTGKIKLAIAVTDFITEEPSKSYALECIVEKLINDNKIDRAIAVAKTIPEPFTKISHLGDIAKMLPNGDKKTLVLNDIAITLAEGGEIVRASQVAHTMPYGD